jgi:putative hydrolase of the HAD superfamily
MGLRGAFDRVETWIFDLDNTLYPSSCRLFDQIDERMGTFIAQLLKVDRIEARRIQKQFFYEHGTTLRGLMTDHGVNPDEFLDFVHDIDHSPIPADPALAKALQALPGRKLVFTNGTVAHADKVLSRLGLMGHFSGIFDIVHADYIPKPALGPYQKFVRDHAIETGRAAMFEDIARNLEVPHRLGMTTVLVCHPGNEDAQIVNAQDTGGRDNGGRDDGGRDDGGWDHVHYRTDDLARFLQGIVADRAGALPRTA